VGPLTAGGGVGLAGLAGFAAFVEGSAGPPGWYGLMVADMFDTLLILFFLFVT